MTKMYAVCKRCHRLRPLKEAGYCESCRETLRAAERPKHRLSEIDLDASPKPPVSDAITATDLMPPMAPGAHEAWANQLADSLVMAGENPELGELEFEEGEASAPEPAEKPDR